MIAIVTDSGIPLFSFVFLPSGRVTPKKKKSQFCKYTNRGLSPERSCQGILTCVCSSCGNLGSCCIYATIHYPRSGTGVPDAQSCTSTERGRARGRVVYANAVCFVLVSSLGVAAAAQRRRRHEKCFCALVLRAISWALRRGPAHAAVGAAGANKLVRWCFLGSRGGTGRKLQFFVACLLYAKVGETIRRQAVALLRDVRLLAGSASRAGNRGLSTLDK